jgi:hypothetical protein
MSGGRSRTLGFAPPYDRLFGGGLLGGGLFGGGRRAMRSGEIRVSMKGASTSKANSSPPTTRAAEP